MTIHSLEAERRQRIIALGLSTVTLSSPEVIPQIGLRGKLQLLIFPRHSQTLCVFERKPRLLCWQEQHLSPCRRNAQAL
jgi:hypothetical protein